MTPKYLTFNKSLNFNASSSIPTFVAGNWSSTDYKFKDETIVVNTSSKEFATKICNAIKVGDLMNTTKLNIFVLSQLNESIIANDDKYTSISISFDNEENWISMLTDAIKNISIIVDDVINFRFKLSLLKYEKTMEIKYTVIDALSINVVIDQLILKTNHNFSTSYSVTEVDSIKNISTGSFSTIATAIRKLNSETFSSTHIQTIIKLIKDSGGLETDLEPAIKTEIKKLITGTSIESAIKKLILIPGTSSTTDALKNLISGTSSTTDALENLIPVTGTSSAKTTDGDIKSIVKNLPALAPLAGLFGDIFTGSLEMLISGPQANLKSLWDTLSLMDMPSLTGGVTGGGNLPSSFFD